jgi:hypothetical protein
MARELLSESSAYGPDTLKILYQAFDEAWASIAEKYADDPDRAEIARLKLANTILSFPIEDIKDAQQITCSSLQIMALQGAAANDRPSPDLTARA